ncbi:head-tail connector protein [Desulfopila aestuarii]|uniref:Phage gp6-like head-tail connector protein n=1 Tax=Desulfopila aestuarii DSM 18488 TaxID=1121416 RepID=A0A1M7YJQ3_9BACT|nr:head-tail connector protein [Desulfopila aestuarii]SHO52855.1 phage conserved hypothetical protein, phiE125 gp8 family [Desulfopila aestuarii DSM 18488]
MRPELTKAELIQGPAELPISAEEIRTHLWTIYPEKTTDEYLELLIKAATSHVETVTWRKLVSQKWRLYLDRWPVGGIVLPFGSVVSVEMVKWLDGDGVDHTLVSGSDYLPAVVGPEPMVMPLGSSWPSGTLFDVDPIRVEFTAGFGSKDKVPEDLRQAIQLLAAHWYEVREAVVVGTTVRKVPFAVDALIGPWKVRRW